MNPTHWALKGLKILFLGTLFVVALGFVTMTLWNYLIPPLFNGPVLSFWQTLGLLVLVRLFTGFKGGGGGWARDRRGEGAPWASRRKKWRAKMQQRLSALSEEQRAEYRARMAKCGPRWACWDSARDESTAPPAAKPAAE